LLVLIYFATARLEVCFQTFEMNSFGAACRIVDHTHTTHQPALVRPPTYYWGRRL